MIGDIPLVSVVIPCRNAGSFIESCINSVRQQSYDFIEIIVVDDGSTDDSLEKIRKFSDAKIRILEGDQRGAGAARNLGYTLAKGDLIQYLDADDILHHDKISQQVREWMLAGRGDRLLTSSFWHFEQSLEDASFRDLPIYSQSAPIDFLVTSWTGGGFLQTNGWLVPRVLHERAGLWSERRINPNDDGEFFTRVILASRELIYCRESIFYYRLPRPGSLATQRGREVTESLLWSLTESAGNLLSAEDSQRTRNAVRANLSRFVWECGPLFPDLALRAERFVSSLGMGGLNRSDFDPGGITGFLMTIVGWRLARKIQAKYHRNRAHE